MSDEPLYLPATYADESYEDNPKQPGPLVLAQFADHAEMSWHAALLAQCRTRELKFDRFQRLADSLPPDLVRRALNGMRQAMIVIVDDTEHAVTARALVENLSRKRLVDLEPPERRRVEGIITGYASREVLRESTLPKIESFVGAVNVGRLLQDPRKARNVRIVAARAVAAFPELVDPQHSSGNAPVDEPLFSRSHPYMHLFEQSSRITRVFDEGNALATDVIRVLRERVRNRLDDDLLDDPIAAQTTEADSAVSAHVGASDLAAGRARFLYGQSDGRRRVADAFDLVILNGIVLRP